MLSQLIKYFKFHFDFVLKMSPFKQNIKENIHITQYIAIGKYIKFFFKVPVLSHFSILLEANTVIVVTILAYNSLSLK